MGLAYLAMGRPVVIAEFDVDDLLGVIEAEQVTGFFAIATMLPRLVNAAEEKESTPRRSARWNTAGHLPQRGSSAAPATSSNVTSCRLGG